MAYEVRTCAGLVVVIGEYAGARYSIPFFAQANRDVVITPPRGTYPPITAADYLRQRVAANYAGPRT